MKRAILFSCLGTCILIFAACDLHQQEAEETGGSYYLLLATGFGDSIEMEWGFQRNINGAPEYHQRYSAEHQGEDWARLEIPEQDVRHENDAEFFGDASLYLKAVNPKGGPVATTIALNDACGQELILQEGLGMGSAESVAPIEVDEEPVNLYPGGYPIGSNFGGLGTGTKVICAELHRQGLMAEEIFEADEAFGRYLRDNHPDVLLGYHSWAKPLVSWMRKSRTVTAAVNLVATPWTYEMAYLMGAREKGSTAGKVLMFIGIPACRVLGRVVAEARAEGPIVAQGDAQIDDDQAQIQPVADFPVHPLVHNPRDLGRPLMCFPVGPFAEQVEGEAGEH